MTPWILLVWPSLRRPQRLRPLRLYARRHAGRLDGLLDRPALPVRGTAGYDAVLENHGQYVSCVARTSQSFYQQWLITLAQRDAIVSAAGRSSYGK